MNPHLLERQAALAGVALVATLGSLALDRASAGEPPTVPDEATPLPAAGTWYEAAVGTYGPGLYGRTTDCGVKLTRNTVGIAHPVLPCGARIVVEHRGRQRETRVVDRGPYRGSHEFDLTQRLANELGINGVEIVRWRFAGDTV